MDRVKIEKMIHGTKKKVSLKDLKNFTALTEARIKGRLERASHTPPPRPIKEKTAPKRKHHGRGLLTIVAAFAAILTRLFSV